MSGRKEGNGERGIERGEREREKKKRETKVE